MAKRTVKATPRPAPAGMSIRRVEPVLIYDGSAMTPDGVPPRDLTVADLVRIHRVRALHASGGAAVAGATADELEDLAAELSATGAFARLAPAAEPVATPTDQATDQPQPATPADEETPA